MLVHKIRTGAAKARRVPTFKVLDPATDDLSPMWRFRETEYARKPGCDATALAVNAQWDHRSRHIVVCHGGHIVMAARLTPAIAVGEDQWRLPLSSFVPFDVRPGDYEVSGVLLAHDARGGLFFVWLFAILAYLIPTLAEGARLLGDVCEDQSDVTPDTYLNYHFTMTGHRYRDRRYDNKWSVIVATDAVGWADNRRRLTENGFVVTG